MMSDGSNTKISENYNLNPEQINNVEDVISPNIKTPSEEIDNSVSTVTTKDDNGPETLKCIEDFKNKLSPIHTPYSSDENEDTNSQSENTLMFNITEKSICNWGPRKQNNRIRMAFEIS